MNGEDISVLCESLCKTYLEQGRLYSELLWFGLRPSSGIPKNTKERHFRN
jgi:hypothetical protein